MGKHSQASASRTQSYFARRQGMKLEAVNLTSHVYSSRNIRNMWVSNGTAFDGTPRRVPGRMSLWHKGGRINAYPPFVDRSGRVRVVPMA